MIKDGLRVLTIEAAFINVPEAFYRTYPTEAQIALSNFKTTNVLLGKLLDGGHTIASGRVAGALRRMGRGNQADTIVRKMKAADYDVREKDPFADIAHVAPFAIGVSPLGARINSA